MAGGYYHLQWAQQYLGRLDEAYENAATSNHLYRRLAEEDPTDQRAIGNYARSLRWRAETEIVVGRTTDAVRHLMQSLELHDQLLTYEPDNMTFQYQGCFSMVLLAELYWSEGNRASAEATINSGCPTRATTLALDHFKVHQRFLGYRLALLQAEIAISEEDMARASQLHQQAQLQWQTESQEVVNSLQGMRIMLGLAMQRVELAKHNGSLPSARAQLAQAIADAEISPVSQSPSWVLLLDRARGLFSQTGASIEQAR